VHLFSGSVRELSDHLSTPERRTRLVEACETRYQDRYGPDLGDGERESWRRSWPKLVHALHQAGLDDLHLSLELELPACSQRADAVLLGTRPDGGLTAVVIELKQWTTIDTTSATRTTIGESGYTHPCAQAAGYVRRLRDWLDAEHLRLEIRGVALLHDAPPGVTTPLREAADQLEASREIGIAGAPDLARPATELARILLADDLRPPSTDVVRDFLNVRHRPSERLLTRLADVVSGNQVFDLVGAQQDAYLTVLDKIAKAREGGKHLVVVTGGPGTGKSVIALRLLAAIPRHGITARYVTPSGTLRHQLSRAVKDADADGLFVFLRDHVRHKPKFAQVSLVDEAQRMRRSKNYVKQLMSITRVCVLFLDERQIIRPDEGLTLEECQAEADRLGATCHPVKLTAQFRCDGSLNYLNWLENLLFAEGRPASAMDYDLGLAQDPEDLANWVAVHNSNGETARIAAGFCWEWSKTGRLNNDVSIDWTDSNGHRKNWQRPWNASADVRAGGTVIAPRSQFWATDEGGQNQIGCIYTCQGLEYDYAGVILGPDFVRRDGQWVGVPDESKDPHIRNFRLSPEEYTRLATNIYYVLASRGIRGCRLYSTDEETQNYLSSLLAPPR
jgi:hypothetical protein